MRACMRACVYGPFTHACVCVWASVGAHIRESGEEGKTLMKYVHTLKVQAGAHVKCGGGGGGGGEARERGGGGERERGGEARERGGRRERERERERENCTIQHVLSPPAEGRYKYSRPRPISYGEGNQHGDASRI